MNTSRRALLTFAFVSEALKSHRDIIVGLSPLFGPIATDLEGQIFTPKQLCHELTRRYGLSISTDVAEFMSFGLQKAGLLKRKNIGSSDISFFWAAPVQLLRNTSADLGKKIEQLAESALKFAKENPTLLTWNLSADVVLDAIFDWLIEQDKEVKAVEHMLEMPKDHAIAPPTRDPPRTRTEQEYFCYRFITWLKENELGLYDVLSEIANVLLIAEVVLELRNPSISSNSGKELFVYLDAPLGMDLLGCSGHARKEDASYLIERLRQFNATICMFAHSIDEIR